MTFVSITLGLASDLWCVFSCSMVRIPDRGVNKVKDHPGKLPHMNCMWQPVLDTPLPAVKSGAALWELWRLVLYGIGMAKGSGNHGSIRDSVFLHGLVFTCKGGVTLHNNRVSSSSAPVPRLLSQLSVRLVSVFSRRLISCEDHLLQEWHWERWVTSSGMLHVSRPHG